MSAGPLEIRPAELPAPRGYAHGMVAEGKVLAVAGQIGTLPNGALVSHDFVEQFSKALDNVLTVVRAAGGEAKSIIQMTVYVTDLDAYRAATKALHLAWVVRLGRHYPAMALLAVSGLVEPGAKVEITALAVLT